MQTIELFHPNIMPWARVETEEAMLLLKDELIDGHSLLPYPARESEIRFESQPCG